MFFYLLSILYLHKYQFNYHKKNTPDLMIITLEYSIEHYFNAKLEYCMGVYTQKIILLTFFDYFRVLDHHTILQFNIRFVSYNLH